MLTLHIYQQHKPDICYLYSGNFLKSFRQNFVWSLKYSTPQGISNKTPGPQLQPFIVLIDGNECVQYTVCAKGIPGRQLSFLHEYDKHNSSIQLDASFLLGFIMEWSYTVCQHIAVAKWESALLSYTSPSLSSSLFWILCRHLHFIPENEMPVCFFCVRGRWSVNIVLNNALFGRHTAALGISWGSTVLGHIWSSFCSELREDQSW